MTNFSWKEFRDIWNKFRNHVISNWEVGRGWKSSFKAMDVFFMFLAVLKHEGQCDLLDKMFKIKGPTFERLISGFIDKNYYFSYNEFVQKNLKYFTFEELNNKKETIHEFSFRFRSIGCDLSDV